MSKEFDVDGFAKELKKTQKSIAKEADIKKAQKAADELTKLMKDFSTKVKDVDKEVG